MYLRACACACTCVRLQAPGEHSRRGHTASESADDEIANDLSLSVDVDHEDDTETMFQMD